MTHIPLVSMNTSKLLARFIDSADVLFPSNAANSIPDTGGVHNPVVVTGQQVGLFGGPLYTLNKIRTAVRVAAEESERTGQTVTSVFWLEDNDHDAVEASTVWLPEPNGSLSKHVLADNQNKAPVSTLRFTNEQAALMVNLAAKLDGRYADETRDRMQHIYTEGKPWSDAFIEVLAPYLEHWNVSVIRASDVLAQGGHAGIVRQDLESTELVDAITRSGDALAAMDFDIQASAGTTLFFLLVDGNRSRLHREGGGFKTSDGTLWSKQDLLSILDTEPWRFSPTVLGRVLVQDAYLPTIASVLGASEVAYHAQLVEAYRVANIRQPRIQLRNHGLPIDAKTERLLAKLGMQPQEFFTSLEALQAQCVADQVENLPANLATSELLQQLAQPFYEVVNQLDTTLVNSVNRTVTSAEDAFESLRGKIKTAIKRKNAELLDRLQSVWWTLYPNNTPAERILSATVLESRIGIQGLRIIADNIADQESSQFSIVGISEVATVS